MVKERFSKPQALRFGWDIWKKNIGFFMAVLFISFLVRLAPAFLAAIFKDEAPFVSALANIFYSLIGIIISIGFIKIALSFCKGKQPEIADLFRGYRFFFIFLFGSILYGLIFLGGVVLLVVPAIIWGIQFQFFTYFIIDQKAGPIEALKRSSRITRGVKFELFIFNMMVLGINLLGLLAFGVGVLVSAPVTMLATAFVYRKLLEAERHQPAVEVLLK
ncbi:MAG: DUF975 family protein [Candidatus Omnitrophota bacterium]